MKSNTILTVSLAVVALTSGCVGTGPNTQQGAVGGAAAGAILGGIIGHNHGSRNTASGAAIGAVAGGLAGATVGNSLDHQRGTLYTSEADARTTYAVQEPPPPPPPPAPVREVVVASPPGAVWVDGYYLYDRAGYEWVPGHWEVPPPRYRTFVRPHWERRGGSYLYVRGYWR